MRQAQSLLGAAVLLALGWVAALHLGIELRDLGAGVHNAVVFVQGAFPPDWSVLDVAMEGLLDTLGIAYLGTLFGMTISLPLAVIAARNLGPVWITTPLRLMFAAIRTLPSFLWAILFVVIVGPGSLAGVLAMTFYTVGYLGKLQYEAFEGLPRITLDTTRAMGMPKWQQVRYAVFPESANALVSQALFMFEYNVRATSIIGWVGAGGIGVALNNYVRFFQYDAVTTILIVILAAVVIIDLASIRLRARFFEADTARKPTWRDVLAPWAASSR